MRNKALRQQAERAAAAGKATATHAAGPLPAAQAGALPADAAAGATPPAPAVKSPPRSAPPSVAK
eukprot:3998377-Alexandrium_andersonii.AAC.1